MEREYTSEVDLSRIDKIIEKAVKKVCKELGYTEFCSGFEALHNRIHEIKRLTNGVGYI